MGSHLGALFKLRWDTSEEQWVWGTAKRGSTVESESSHRVYSKTRRTESQWDRIDQLRPVLLRTSQIKTFWVRYKLSQTRDSQESAHHPRNKQDTLTNRLRVSSLYLSLSLSSVKTTWTLFSTIPVFDLCHRKEKTSYWKPTSRVSDKSVDNIHCVSKKNKVIMPFQNIGKKENCLELWEM